MIIRKGQPSDIPSIHELVLELAIYEKAPQEVTNTIEEMISDGFGDDPIFGFFVAEDRNKIVGMALYYNRYSTWKGKMLYLEDLIVTEKYRKNGVGTKLMDAVIQEAEAKGCKGIQWQVLEWNQPAIDFYQRYQPSYDSEWVNCRIMLNGN